MKRITILSILLALMMVCVGIFTSCESQGVTPNEPSHTDETPSEEQGTPGLTYSLQL